MARHRFRALSLLARVFPVGREAVLPGDHVERQILVCPAQLRVQLVSRVTNVTISDAHQRRASLLPFLPPTAIPGNFFSTARFTVTFSPGVPCCETRARALRAWLLFGIGYEPAPAPFFPSPRPGKAKSAFGIRCRSFAVSFAISPPYAVIPAAWYGRCAKRLLQPCPNVFQVERFAIMLMRAPCAATSTSCGSAFFSAASVCGPTTPSAATPSALCRNLLAAPTPLFTAASISTRARPGSTLSRPPAVLSQ